MSYAQRGGFKVGLLLSTRLAKQVRMAEPAEFVAFCRAAETAGFDSLWVADSLLARRRFELLSVSDVAAVRPPRVASGSTNSDVPKYAI